MNHKHKIFATVACIAFSSALLVPQTASAEPASAVGLPALVPDEDLDKLRGGFVVNGLGVNFGADIRTYVNGELMLQTVLNWGADGAETVQTAAAGLSPVDVSTLENGVLSNGNIRMKVGDTPVYLLNNGQTAIVHETASGVQNMLINTASDFEAVQEVDATLTLSGYESFNSDMMMDRIGNALGDVVGQGAIGALGN